MSTYYFYFENGIETCVRADSVDEAFAFIKQQAAIVSEEDFPHYNLAKLETFSEGIEKYEWSEIYNVWKDKPSKSNVVVNPFPDIEEYLETVKELIPYLINIVVDLGVEIAYFYSFNILQRLLVLNKFKSIVFIPHANIMMLDNMPFPLERDAFTQYKRLIGDDPFDLWSKTTIAVTIVPEDPKLTWVFFREELDLFSPPTMIVQRNLLVDNRIVWETTEINSGVKPPSVNVEGRNERINETRENPIIRRYFREFNAHPNSIDMGIEFPSHRKNKSGT